MAVRIIGGSRRGTRLATLSGTNTRPLLGRVRQSLFDVLGPRVVDACVLDLYAGSGAVGLEALSRGARWLTLVDQSPSALQVIRRNIAKLRFESLTRVSGGSLPAAVDAIPLAPGSVPYDLVFIMPPFGQNLLPPTLERLVHRVDLLAPAALVVAQFETGETVPEPPPPSLEAVDERVYGTNHLVVWERKGPAENGTPRTEEPQAY